MAINLCARCSSKRRRMKTEYCEACLGSIIEQRAKKALAGGNPACKATLIACNDRRSLACASASYIVKNVAASPLWRNRNSKHPVIITARCADELAAGFMGELIGAKSEVPKAPKKAINLFESLTEKELSAYASMKRIKYTKAKSTGLKLKIQAFQERYPGTIEALAKSSRKLRQMMNNGRN